VLFVALIFPHPPFEVEEPWYSLHARASLPLPVAADLSRKPAYMRAMHDRMRLGRLGESEWRELRGVYAGMTSRVDVQLGRVVTALEKAGVAERTLELFFTDHGEYLGDYGLVEKWPSGLDDCLLRNPLIIAGPDVAHGATCNALVEMIDLVPTLAERCDLTIAHTQFGRSLSRQLAGSGDAHRDALFAEGGFTAAEEPLLERAVFPYDIKAAIQHENPVYAGRAIAVRTVEWTYIQRLYEEPELYSRRDDPHETRNRAGEPDLASVEQTLRNRIFAWLFETSDVIPSEVDPRF
jgi:arylsulfatase A-like enzyme